MSAVSLRCAHCGEAISVRDDVRLLTCAACGSGLAVVREGGAIYAVVDRNLKTGAAPARGADVGGAWAQISARPRRASAALAGAVALAAGLAWAILSAAAGSAAWIVALGAGVAAAGALAFAYALRRRSQ